MNTNARVSPSRSRSLLGTLLVCVLPLSMGCADLRESQQESNYCGMTGEIHVFVEPDNAFTSCSDALTVTHGALAEEARLAGPLLSTWDVLFTWHLIDVTHSLAELDPSTRMIRVGERNPQNVLHELLHARLFETDHGSAEDHITMCATGWDGAERAFGVRDTCQE